MRGITKYVVAVIVLLVVFGGIYAYMGVGMPRGESTYTGYVVDVEHDSGILLKTTQVHIKTHPRSSSHETFCVLDQQNPDQLEMFRGALENSSQVTVQYSRPLYVAPNQCNGGLSVIRGVSVDG